MHQPLLVHIDKKKNNTEKYIYLIPELCVMTGLSDYERRNRNLMQQIDSHVKPSATERLEKCRGMVKFINE